MSEKPEKDNSSVKQTKGKPEAEYTPPPLPVGPEAPKSFVPTADFLQTLRKATPYVPPSTDATRSKIFSKLAVAEENATTSAGAGGVSPTPEEKPEPNIIAAPQTPAVPVPVTQKANPAESPRIIIRPIKEPPKRIQKSLAVIKSSRTISTPAETPSAKETPATKTPENSIFAENPWETVKAPKSPPEEGRIQNPWAKTPVTKPKPSTPTEGPVTKPKPSTPTEELVTKPKPSTSTEEPVTKPKPSTPTEQPVPVAKKFDWKAIRAQSDVLWNYIGQLLDWLQEMVLKADQMQKSVVIERVNTIRNKIELNFGITFPDMESEKLPNVEILRIAMEYVRYLKENFNPNYYLCPSCNFILAFYYPVPALPCPTCGSKLEPTSPERE